MCRLMDRCSGGSPFWWGWCASAWSFWRAGHCHDPFRSGADANDLDLADLRRLAQCLADLATAGDTLQRCGFGPRFDLTPGAQMRITTTAVMPASLNPELMAWVQRILDRDAPGAMAVPVRPVPSKGPAGAEVVL